MAVGHCYLIITDICLTISGLDVTAVFRAHISLTYCMVSNYCTGTTDDKQGLPTTSLIHVPDDINISPRPNYLKADILAVAEISANQPK